MSEFYLVKMLCGDREIWQVYHCRIGELKDLIEDFAMAIIEDGFTFKLLAVKQVTQTFDLDISKL